MDSALRPMSASQVLDRTFYLYRNNFWLFAGIAMVTPALTTLFSIAQIRILGMPVAPDPSKLDPQMMQQMLQDMVVRAIFGMTAGLAVYAVGNAIASGATVYAVSMLHLGKATTIQDSYSRIKGMFWRILLLVVRIFFIAAWPIALLYGLLFAVALSMPGLMKGNAAAGQIIFVLGGLLLLFFGFIGAIIWFFFAYCRYALAVPACTIENLPVRYALVRSKFLTKGSIMRVLGIYLLTLVIAFAVNGVLKWPALMATGMFSMRPGMHLSPGWLIWLYASDFLGTMVAGPIATIAMAVVYYDERVRKEAFDLQLMMDSLTPASTVAPASS